MARLHSQITNQNQCPFLLTNIQEGAKKFEYLIARKITLTPHLQDLVVELTKEILEKFTFFGIYLFLKIISKHVIHIDKNQP